MRDTTLCYSCKFFSNTCDGTAEICTFTPKTDKPKEEWIDNFMAWAGEDIDE